MQSLTQWHVVSFPRMILTFLTIRRPWQHLKEGAPTKKPRRRTSVHGWRLEQIGAQLGSLPALVPVHKSSNIVRRSNDFMAMLNCTFFFLVSVWFGTSGIYGWVRLWRIQKAFYREYSIYNNIGWKYRLNWFLFFILNYLFIFLDHLDVLMIKII